MAFLATEPVLAVAPLKEERILHFIRSDLVFQEKQPCNAGGISLGQAVIAHFAVN